MRIPVLNRFASDNPLARKGESAACQAAETCDSLPLERLRFIGRESMRTITASAARKLGRFLTRDFREIFGPTQDDLAERLGSLARITIECIGQSDALYHNYEHTWLVTMAGRDILQGLRMSRGIEPADYTHLIVSCLLHDIGYVRGILSGDTGDEFVVNEDGQKIALPRGASDAALMPYHVDRSKLFAMERLGNSSVMDVARIVEAIEYTRFPPSPERRATETNIPRLVQAADLIGQLGDPMYPRKVNALFYEFEETGRNRQLGYSSPADLVEKYPDFYWNSVSEYLDEAIKYLNLTASGRQWIANLHHHLLCAENAQRLMGPQH
jgi:hypothetical protein